MKSRLWKPKQPNGVSKTLKDKLLLYLAEWILPKGYLILRDFTKPAPQYIELHSNEWLRLEN